MRESREGKDLVLLVLTRRAEKVNKSKVSVYADVGDKKTNSANRDGRSDYMDVTQRLPWFAERRLLRGDATYPKIQQSLRTKAALSQVFAPFACACFDSMFCVRASHNPIAAVLGFKTKRVVSGVLKHHQRKVKASKTLPMQ